MSDAYRALEARFKRVHDIEGALAILSWDQATMLPKGSVATRAEQMAALKLVAQETLTGPAVTDRLREAEEDKDGLNDWQRANLREMRRVYEQSVALPPDLLGALTRACATCEMAWREAREADDFAALVPHLREVVRLSQEAARAKAERYRRDAYAALLHDYEPGLSVARIDALLSELAEAIPPLLERILAQQARRAPRVPPEGVFPIERQRQLAERLMRAMGFDFNQGRLDVSVHPFCGGVPGDVRITTRYTEDDVTSALMGVVHETGHALYEANRPADWLGQPVSEARSMTVHESQSLLVEMQACRSTEFLDYLATLLPQAFGRDDPGFTAARLRRVYHHVEPSLIRVDADEVTYPLHIVLRYRLERALIEGDLRVEDLPGAWREGMRELLGVVPQGDADGCMQDIHWPVGAFGYFPCYTLGALAAAQLYRAALAAAPEISQELRSGQFSRLMGWLHHHVHSQGSLHDTETLITQASGTKLSTDAFLAHLERRYLVA